MRYGPLYSTEARGMAAILVFLLFSAISSAEEPIATYNGTINTVTDTGAIAAVPSTGAIPPGGAISGNFTRDITDNRILTFTILQPPATVALVPLGGFSPTPPAATIAQPQITDVAKAINESDLLRDALSEVFGGPLTQELIGNIVRTSGEVLGQITTPSRSLSIGTAVSTLSLSFEYAGTETVKNFVVYDTVPKSFARNASLVMVSAPGAVVRVVMADPVYTFTYPELSPGQKVDIRYTVNARVNKSVLDDTKAPVLMAEKIKATAFVPPPPAEKMPPQRGEEKPPPSAPPPRSLFAALAEGAPFLVIPVFFMVVILLAVIAVRTRPKQDYTRNMQTVTESQLSGFEASIRSLDSALSGKLKLMDGRLDRTIALSNAVSKKLQSEIDHIRDELSAQSEYIEKRLAAVPDMAGAEKVRELEKGLAEDRILLGKITAVLKKLQENCNAVSTSARAVPGQYQERLNNLEGKVTSIQSQLKELDGKLVAMKEYLRTIKDDISKREKAQARKKGYLVLD